MIEITCFILNLSLIVKAENQLY